MWFVELNHYHTYAHTLYIKQKRSKLDYLQEGYPWNESHHLMSPMKNYSCNYHHQMDLNMCSATAVSNPENRFQPMVSNPSHVQVATLLSFIKVELMFFSALAIRRGSRITMKRRRTEIWRKRNFLKAQTVLQPPAVQHSVLAQRQISPHLISAVMKDEKAGCCLSAAAELLWHQQGVIAINLQQVEQKEPVAMGIQTHSPHTFLVKSWIRASRHLTKGLENSIVLLQEKPG